ncbi:hypothetical protein D9M68_912990 [compost metagenome]
MRALDLVQGDARLRFADLLFQPGVKVVQGFAGKVYGLGQFHPVNLAQHVSQYRIDFGNR